MSEVLYNDMVAFYVLGNCFALFKGETNHGEQTVAEVNNKYYYLGEQPLSIQTVIRLYEDLNGKQLSLTEFQNVMSENGFEV